MRIEKIIRPGRPGTKKWFEKFGKDLVCIRYLIDEANNRRLKTAEIIIDEKQPIKRVKKSPVNKLMPLKIHYNETYLKKLIIAAGGKWNSKRKVWELASSKIIELGLEEKLVVIK